MSGQPDAPSLSDELRRLEEIVRRLEADDLDLDGALALFEEGIARLRTARGLLQAAELKVKQVLAAGEDGVEVKDLDA